MKKQRNRFQTKEQDKSLETDLNEMEISDLPDKEFKITKMLTELRRTRHEISENFSRETEYIRKYQTEITELKNTVTEQNIPIASQRMDQQPQRQGNGIHPIREEKRIKESEDSLRDLRDTIKWTTTLMTEVPEGEKGAESFFKETG